MSKSIHDDVMNQIKEGKVQMHPDWYFALLTTGFAVALSFTLVTAIYAFNLALLRLEIAHEGMQPMLLGRYYLDTRHLPIGFLLVALLAIVGVIQLLRKRSQYARALPEWSIALGVIVFVLCLGAGLSRSPLNRPLERGPFHRLYEQQERPMMRRGGNILFENRERIAPPTM